MAKIALIDGNGLSFGIYQQFACGKEGLLQNSVGIPTTVMFGMLRSLNVLVEKTNFDYCVLCWDLYGSYYRRGIWPEYKKARKEKEQPFDMKEYFSELDDARMYFEKLGISQAIAEGVEADDLIGWLAVKYANRKDNVVIISNDKDFYQLPARRIKIYRPIKEEYVTGEDIKELFEMPKASYYNRMLALIGDKDEVPGIYRLGEKTAIKLLKEYDWNFKKLVKEHEKEYATEKDGEKKKLAKIKPSRFLALKMARIRVKDKQYLDWEVKLLKDIWKKVGDIKEKNSVKMSTINQLRDFLEIKKVNVSAVLRKIGVNVSGKIKKRKEWKV